MIDWPDVTMTHVGSDESDCCHMVQDLVQDVRWGKCSSRLGWTYLNAFNQLVCQCLSVHHCLEVTS